MDAFHTEPRSAPVSRCLDAGRCLVAGGCLNARYFPNAGDCLEINKDLNNKGYLNAEANLYMQSYIKPKEKALIIHTNISKTIFIIDVNSKTKVVQIDESN